MGKKPGEEPASSPPKGMLRRHRSASASLRDESKRAPSEKDTDSTTSSRKKNNSNAQEKSSIRDEPKRAPPEKDTDSTTRSKKKNNSNAQEKSSIRDEPKRAPPEKDTNSKTSSRKKPSSNAQEKSSIRDEFKRAPSEKDTCSTTNCRHQPNSNAQEKCISSAASQENSDLSSASARCSCYVTICPCPEEKASESDLKVSDPACSFLNKTSYRMKCPGPCPFPENYDTCASAAETDDPNVPPKKKKNHPKNVTQGPIADKCHSSTASLENRPSEEDSGPYPCYSSSSTLVSKRPSKEDSGPYPSHSCSSTLEISKLSEEDSGPYPLYSSSSTLQINKLSEEDSGPYPLYSSSSTLDSLPSSTNNTPITRSSENVEYTQSEDKLCQPPLNNTKSSDSSRNPTRRAHRDGTTCRTCPTPVAQLRDIGPCPIQPKSICSSILGSRNRCTCSSNYS